MRRHKTGGIFFFTNTLCAMNCAIKRLKDLASEIFGLHLLKHCIANAQLVNEHRGFGKGFFLLQYYWTLDLTVVLWARII
jgi:hypothetical protein